MGKRNYRPLSLDDPMPFGKYGKKSDNPKKVWQIFEEDPDYIALLIEEYGIQFDDEAYTKYRTDILRQP